MILVTGLTVAIFILNENNWTNTGSENLSSLEGYNQLRNEFNKIATDESISSNPTYEKLVPFINQLGNAKLAEKDRFDKIISSLSYIIDLYSLTNNPKVRPLFEKLGKYAKANAPKYYKPNYFVVFCQDPSCTQHQQPKEILAIIKALQISDIEPEIKNSMILDLTNTGYIENEFKNLKYNNYLGIAIMLYESDSALSPSLRAKKIGKELLDYIKKTYPDIYNYKPNEI